MGSSSPGFEGGSGGVIRSEPSGVGARVLQEIVSARPRVLRPDVLPLDRMIVGSLVNSQVMPLAVHFWHGCCKLHFTLAFAHASQDLRRDRLL